MGEVRSAATARFGFHPMWWGALTLLVVNDHVLKESAVLPPLATGKLSDVAGLIVAPVLLSRLLHRRRPYSEKLAGLAFLFVGASFTLVNLSQACADRLTGVLTALGFPSRMWADESDLWALLVLPIAWTLERSTSEVRWPELHDRVHQESWLRFGALLGSLACLATSTHVEAVSTASYLFNGTRHELSVDLHPAHEGFDCDALGDAPGAILSPEMFEEGACLTVKPFEALMLDPHARNTDDEESTNVAEHCDAAFVRVESAPPTLLVWRSSPQVTIPLSVGDPEFDEVLSDPHSVLVEQLGVERLWAPGSHIQALEVIDEETMPTSTCGSSP